MSVCAVSFSSVVIDRSIGLTQCLELTRDDGADGKQTTSHEDTHGLAHHNPSLWGNGDTRTLKDDLYKGRIMAQVENNLASPNCPTDSIVLYALPRSCTTKQSHRFQSCSTKPGLPHTRQQHYRANCVRHSQEIAKGSFGGCFRRTECCSPTRFPANPEQGLPTVTYQLTLRRLHGQDLGGSFGMLMQHHGHFQRRRNADACRGLTSSWHQNQVVGLGPLLHFSLSAHHGTLQHLLAAAPGAGRTLWPMADSFQGTPQGTAHCAHLR
ncbi:hypothetical protein FB567DRAFT_254321 [Paraphoma chrysanthemicola]|uniref:Uncharacterized protein n=1 Tax=Paraphoma chrysanthemicola TaxID=798071 RepID=A0A8K0QRR9_9PLEO|nr:hypothetical protein FB567DRAFT_254321 [Paraphoma chrysanthemicola]